MSLSVNVTPTRTGLGVNSPKGPGGQPGSLGALGLSSLGSLSPISSIQLNNLSMQSPNSGGPTSSPSSTGGSPSKNGVGAGLCRKFAPNIFNKSKCQNCFRLREAHSADALETNRVTRNVVKCGYLFLAPDWDFSSQSSRTKRWQRRWFVLLDDGELTYALDEQPDTLPCASIDMRDALEVALADELTGNPFSIALTHSDKIHFVKATCREDAKRWYDVLCRASPNLRSSAKRNQTLPGSLPSASSGLRQGISGLPGLSNDGTTSLEVEHGRECNRETPARQRFFSVGAPTSPSSPSDDNNNSNTNNARNREVDERETQPSGGSGGLASSGDFLSSSPSMVVYQVVNSLLSGTGKQSNTGSGNTANNNTSNKTVNNNQNNLNSSSNNKNSSSSNTNNNNNNSASHVNVVNVNVTATTANTRTVGGSPANVLTSGHLQQKQQATAQVLNSSGSNNSNKSSGLITANSDIFDGSPSLTSTPGLNSLDDCEVMKKRRFLKRETKALKSQRSRSDGVAKMLPPAHIEDNSPSHQSLNSQWNIISSPNVRSTASPGGPVGQRSSLAGGQFAEWRQRPPMVSQLNQTHTPTSQSLATATNTGSPGKRTCHSNSVYLLMSDLGSMDSESSNSPSKHQSATNSNVERKMKTLGSPPQQRGVPDGCPLDLDEDHVDSGSGSLHITSLSPAAALTPLGASSNQTDSHHASGGALLMKKGWLYLRQRYNGQVDWTRLWFVLRQGSLSQFMDPSAEEKGQARGTLDTRALRAATELDNADRNYAFALVWTPSGGESPSRELVLSAATAAIRANWLQAIRQAAAASNALAVAPPGSVGSHGLTLATVSSVGSSTASITSGLTSSSAGGSPGSAMHSAHSDSSRQFRRQLSPTRTTTAASTTIITPTVATVDSIGHCTKDMTLSLGQEKNTPSKRLSSRALSNTQSQVRSPDDSGGEGSYFSATDSTPTQETTHSLATRHGGRVELPPSPVPNRNALSKAKHRARSSSAHSRARSAIGSSQMSSESSPAHNILDATGTTATSGSNVQQLEQKISSLASGVSIESEDDDNEDDGEESSCDLEEDDADDDDNEECLPLDSINGGHQQRLGQGHLSSRHSHPLGTSHPQQGHLQRQSLRGTTMHKIARAQALENKLRVARSDLEAKQAEIDALRRVVATSTAMTSQSYVTSRSLVESAVSRSHESRSLSPSRSCADEVNETSRRAQELVSKSLQLLKNISTKTALKEVKEKCLDLQSHIVSLETLVGDVVELANTANSNVKSAECGLPLGPPRAVPPKSNAAVQTISVTQTERDERLAKAQREIARLTKELIASQKTADDAELQLVRVSNDMKMAAEEHRQQSTLLNLRLDDLTAKLSASEKNVKLAKQKLARLEKRRLSLKGKDASLNLSKDIETKLSNLEAKMLFLEDMSTMTDSQSDISEDLRSHAAPPTPGLGSKQPVNRRLSTDSQNSETNTSAHRIFHLDQKVKAAVEAAGGMPMKAKLYLQSRGVKDPLTIEEWQTGPHSTLGAMGTASLSASMTDLTELAMDPGLDPSCSSITSMSPYECLEMLSQRVDSLLCWFTSSLQGLRRGAEDAPWCRLLGQLLELIDHLSCACDRVPGSLQGRGAADKASLGLAYNLLLLQETARAVRMVNDTDRDLRHSLHGSARQMHRVLASFNASLNQNCFTADAIFEGLQQGLRATEQSGSSSLVEDFVSASIDPIAALGDAVAQVKAQFDCAAMKVADYKRGKRTAIQESLARLLANHSRRGYGLGAGDMGDYNDGSSPEAWDACACVARQEALLSRVTEAIARVSTSVGFYLDKSLGHGSTLLINFDKMPEPAQMKALIADALQTDIDLLNYELRKDCIEVLDVSVFGDSGMPGSSMVSGIGAPVDDSVMSAMETEILPEVNEVVTLICVFAIFKGYLAYLDQQSSSSSCLAETFRRISSPPVANSEQANTTGGGPVGAGGGGAPSIASSAQVLESVHSKFFEMLLMLNGTSDVPQAVERWLACVVNSSHASSPGEHMSSSPMTGTSFSQGSAGQGSNAGLHSGGGVTAGSHPSSSNAMSGGDCGLIIPSLTATVTSAIGRVQAKLAREQDAQKDALNSLRQRLEQVERERSGCDRSLGNSECSSCERLKRQLEDLAQRTDNCENCHRLEKQLQEQTRCAECPALMSRLEEYEAALSAGCPGCERLEKEIEVMEIHMAEQDDIAKRNKHNNSDECNRCEELQRALETVRSSYDSRVTNLQAELESRLREQLQIGEEVHIHRLPRWQNELEQVRQLCDKGIGLLQESHAAEVARLCESFESKLKAERAEKERMIAEETRATQVALEAIQRQHRSHIEELKANLKPSVAALNVPTTEKADISRQDDVLREILQKAAPVANERVLNEIREDIVNLSEKFSKKCVEAAAVQERLYATQKQLQKANTQLFDLLATRARSETPSRHTANTGSAASPVSSLGQSGAQGATSPSKVQQHVQTTETGDSPKPKALSRAKTTLDVPWQPKF